MEKPNTIQAITFNNPNLYNVVGHFAKKYTLKEKLYIRYEELELIPLFLRTADTEEFNYHKTQDNCFFQRLLCLFKEILEKKTGKLLFLTIRSGNYVILDSWYMKWQDWEIESRYREKDFLELMGLYKKACNKVPNIKSVEDFFAVVGILSNEELCGIYDVKDAEPIRKLVAKYKTF